MGVVTVFGISGGGSSMVTQTLTPGGLGNTWTLQSLLALDFGEILVLFTDGFKALIDLLI